MFLRHSILESHCRSQPVMFLPAVRLGLCRYVSPTGPLCFHTAFWPGCIGAILPLLHACPLLGLCPRLAQAPINVIDNDPQERGVQASMTPALWPSGTQGYRTALSMRKDAGLGIWDEIQYFWPMSGHVLVLPAVLKEIIGHQYYQSTKCKSKCHHQEDISKTLSYYSQ